MGGKNATCWQISSHSNLIMKSSQQVFLSWFLRFLVPVLSVGIFLIFLNLPSGRSGYHYLPYVVSSTHLACGLFWNRLLIYSYKIWSRNTEVSDLWVAFLKDNLTPICLPPTPPFPFRLAHSPSTSISFFSAIFCHH